MSKDEILNFFSDINYAYNDSTRLNTLRRMLDELVEQAAPRWHRVEEEPNEEGKYLVCDGRGNYFVAWWGPRLGWCYDPKFFCYWMPIEPPMEDEHGN